MIEKERLELFALKRSMIYWRRILNKEIPDRADYTLENQQDDERQGIKNRQGFPLCQRFFSYKRVRSLKVCVECPITLVTGRTQCQGTPYHEWCSHQLYDHDEKLPFYNQCPECERIIMDILRFLYNIGTTRHPHYFPSTFVDVLDKIRLVMSRKKQTNTEIYESAW